MDPATSAQGKTKPNQLDTIRLLDELRDISAIPSGIEGTILYTRAHALEALWSSIKNNAGWRVGYSAEFTAAVERLRKLENSLGELKARDIIPGPKRTIYGPTHETRNRRFQMDPHMFDLLQLYAIEGPSMAVEAFREGITSGRISEVTNG